MPLPPEQIKLIRPPQPGGSFRKLNRRGEYVD